MLPAAQERLKSDLIFCFMASFFMSGKSGLRIVLVCITQLWFPKNHAAAGDRGSTACLTIFPAYNQCASCVRGSGEAGTRAGLHQLHAACRDIDGFHFLCGIWMQRKNRATELPWYIDCGCLTFFKCLDCGLKGSDIIGVHVDTDGCTLTKGFFNVSQTEKEEAWWKYM